MARRSERTVHVFSYFTQIPFNSRGSYRKYAELFHTNHEYTVPHLTESNFTERYYRFKRNCNVVMNAADLVNALVIFY